MTRVATALRADGRAKPASARGPKASRVSCVPMAEHAPSPTSRPSPWRRLLLVGGILLGSGLFFWSQLPKGGYPTDLSRIGQGQPALVLTMNGNFMAGVEMMPVLDVVRSEFAGRAEFLVASMGLPEGQAFAQRHRTADGSVVVFDAGGRPLAVLHGPRTAGELRQALQLAFDS